MKGLLRRGDLLLLGGLGIAVFVIFSDGLTRLLDYVRAVEQASGLRLLPALMILTAVFVLHQYRKRQQMGAAARIAADRVAEMERLVAFGQAIQRSLDLESIRRVTSEHLPNLVPDRGAWVMIRLDAHWAPMVVVGPASAAVERERAARSALGEIETQMGEAGADVCFPMIVGGTPVGVLGVSPVPALDEHLSSVLTAAASLLAVSIKNAKLFDEAREVGVRDTLTGCVRRGHALEVIDSEMRRARRSGEPVALVIFDLDHFKDVNDRYGHLCGDAVLASVGARMTALLRGSDLKCRYGGEEFLILLPGAAVDGARRVAEGLRRDLARHPVRWNDEQIAVTASFGIAVVEGGDVDVSAAIAEADAALYRAKAAGRNCVVAGGAGVGVGVSSSSKPA